VAYIIQPAKIEEAAELSALVNSAYRGESSRAGWTTEADYIGGQRTNPDLIKRDFFGPDRTMLVLREQANSEILACVSLEWLPNETAYLGMLTVKPALQAKGVGRSLLEASENFARSKGFTKIELSVVHLRDSLMAWYERRGYTRTGVTKPFPYWNEEFGLPNVEGLHFIVFSKNL
jgi:ribosomal protein S18 acetylase RimI-like enzyme